MNLYSNIKKNLNESEDYETNRNDIIKQAAEYIFNDIDGDWDSDLIDYERFTDYYMDLNKRDFDKALKLVQEALGNLAEHHYFDRDYNNVSKNGVLLELNDNHTMWELNNPTLENDDSAWQLWDNIVTNKIDEFKEETGEELYGCGRSGRHICVEPTFENCLNFDKLQEVQEKLEKSAIEEFNNYRAEENITESETEELDQHLIDLVTKKKDLLTDDTIDDDLSYDLMERIDNELINSYSIEEIEKAEKLVGLDESESNYQNGEFIEPKWFKDKELYNEFKKFVDAQLQGGRAIDDPDYVNTLSPEEYESLLVNTWMKDQEEIDMFEEHIKSGYYGEKAKSLVESEKEYYNEKIYNLSKYYYDKMIPLLISDFELASNYEDYTGSPEELDNAVISDIYKDFTQPGLEKIKKDFLSLDYDKNSLEMKDAKEVYNEIKKVFPDFKIERFENIFSESETEDYWDATELDRVGFMTLLKFNNPEEHANPSMRYIITNDNNEVYRFAMQGSTEQIKDTGAKIEFRKYLNSNGLTESESLNESQTQEIEEIIADIRKEVPKIDEYLDAYYKKINKEEPNVKINDKGEINPEWDNWFRTTSNILYNEAAWDKFVAWVKKTYNVDINLNESEDKNLKEADNYIKPEEFDSMSDEDLDEYLKFLQSEWTYHTKKRQAEIGNEIDQIEKILIDRGFYLDTSNPEANTMYFDDNGNLVDKNGNEIPDEPQEKANRPKEGFVVFQTTKKEDDPQDLEDTVFTTKEEAKEALEEWKNSYTDEEKEQFNPTGIIYKYKGMTPREISANKAQIAKELH